MTDFFLFSNVQMAYILGFFFGLGVEILPDAAVAATYREIKCKKTRKSSFFNGKINQNWALCTNLGTKTSAISLNDLLKRWMCWINYTNINKLRTFRSWCTNICLIRQYDLFTYTHFACVVSKRWIGQDSRDIQWVNKNVR